MKKEGEREGGGRVGNRERKEGQLGKEVKEEEEVVSY